MFARFDENPAMTLQVIKETKRYGRTDRRTDGRMHGRTDARTDGRTDNVKTVYPLQTKFAGGIIKISLYTESHSMTALINHNFVLLFIPQYLKVVQFLFG